MKLSEAILLSIGAVIENRAIFLGHNIDGQCEGCAIGTALFSMGYEHVNTWVTGRGPTAEFQVIWPWTKTVIRTQLGTYCIAEQISIRHSKGESRESLANWIASIEPQEESTSTHLLEVEEQVKLLDTSLVSSNEVA